MNTQRLPYWLTLGVAIVFLFMHAPLMVLVLFSFNDSKFSVDWKGFTTRWYERLAERQDIVDGLLSSLTVGLSSTVIATVLGTLMALAIARHEFRGRRAIPRTTRRTVTQSARGRRITVARNITTRTISNQELIRNKGTTKASRNQVSRPGGNLITRTRPARRPATSVAYPLCIEILIVS